MWNYATYCTVAGITNGQADALSRQPDYNQGEEDNKDIVVLPDHLFISVTLSPSVCLT